MSNEISKEEIAKILEREMWDKINKKLEVRDIHKEVRGDVFVELNASTFKQEVEDCKEFLHREIGIEFDAYIEGDCITFKPKKCKN